MPPVLPDGGWPFSKGLTPRGRAYLWALFRSAARRTRARNPYQRMMGIAATPVTRTKLLTSQSGSSVLIDNQSAMVLSLPAFALPNEAF